LKNNALFQYIKKIKEQLNTLYTEDTAYHLAWEILEYVTQKPRAQLLINSDFLLSEKEILQLDSVLNQHITHRKPLQYIFGSVPFCGLTIHLEPPILIPRPETEEWCRNLIDQLKQLKNQHIQILDVCTGSGCIALALADALPKAKVIGTDISEHSLEIAKKNAEINNIKNVSFLYSDVFKEINQQFDLIVANPPYISPEEWKTLDPIVQKWEDQNALVANNDGLKIIEQIIDNAPNYLKNNQEMTSLEIPQLAIEIGYDQGEQVKKIMHNAGFKHITIQKDFADLDRVVTGNL